MRTTTTNHDHSDPTDEVFLYSSVPALRRQRELEQAAVAAGQMTVEQARRLACRDQGICSEPDCGQPIAGWVGHGPKLCYDHLVNHARMLHEEDAALLLLSVDVVNAALTGRGGGDDE